MTNESPHSDAAGRMLAGLTIAIVLAITALDFASGGLIPDQP